MKVHNVRFFLSKYNGDEIVIEVMATEKPCTEDYLFVYEYERAYIVAYESI